MLRDNLLTVQKNILDASRNSGFDKNVTLIAVSKTHPAEQIKEVYDLGVRDFGENKVQELVDKYDKLPKDIKWHMIGHLQTNKVKYIIDKVCLIHSVDSLRLAEEINKQAKKKSLVMDVMVEVNVSGEKSKFGVEYDMAAKLVKDISLLENVRVVGLMTIAPASENPENSRHFFRKLQHLSIDIRSLNIDNILGMYLSMGMSGDYVVAVHEGADFVRVGTGIFGERHYNKDE